MKFKHVLQEAELERIPSLLDVAKGLRDWKAERRQNSIIKNMKELEFGSIYIEFMWDKKTTHIIAKFDSKTNWLFNNDQNKNIVYFDSLNAFISHITQSVSDRYRSDIKKVHQYLFDPKSMEAIFTQIREFIAENELKSKSLTFDKSHSKKGEKDSDWDMIIKFRKSFEEFSKKQNYRIIPKLTGNGKFGKIIGNKEIETKWSQKELEKHIANY